MGQQAFIDVFEASELEDRTFAWWNELDLVPNMSPPVRAEVRVLEGGLMSCFCVCNACKTAACAIQNSARAR